MNFTAFKTQKQNEFNHWVSFSPSGSDLGTSLSFRGYSFVSSSDIGSHRSGWLGFRTYEAKSDVAALDYNSRLRGDINFLNSDSESMQHLGLWGIFWTFRTSVYRVTVRFRTLRVNLGSNPSDFAPICSVSNRKSETEP